MCVACVACVLHQLLCPLSHHIPLYEFIFPLLPVSFSSFSSFLILPPHHHPVPQLHLSFSLLLVFPLSLSSPSLPTLRTLSEHSPNTPRVHRVRRMPSPPSTMPLPPTTHKAPTTTTTRGTGRGTGRGAAGAVRAAEAASSPRRSGAASSFTGFVPSPASTPR